MPMGFQKYFFVTGPGHSGTRLLLRMLARHPEISVPEHILNEVAEYDPLHQFFTESLIKTPIHSGSYAIDEEELSFIIDAYIAACDSSRPFCAIKMPYYPMNCLDFFFSYFHDKVQFVYCSRPVEKIVKSFVSRDEDKLFFKWRPQAIAIQIKKLPVSQRRHFLSNLDAPEFFKALVEHDLSMRDKWNVENPDRQFVAVDMQTVTAAEDECRRFLRALDVDDSCAVDMLQIVNRERLMNPNRIDKQVAEKPAKYSLESTEFSA